MDNYKIRRLENEMEELDNCLLRLKQTCPHIYNIGLPVYHEAVEQLHGEIVETMYTDVGGE